MRERQTIGEVRWPHIGEFEELARAWQADAITLLLGSIWDACDLLRKEVLLKVDCTQADRDLERSLTQYLEPRIHKVMPGDSPFYVAQGWHEFETAKKPKGQPPLPDISFVLWSNERISWPLEAKTLRTDEDVDKYVKELNDNLLSSRYGPFSSGGGMLGYLVAGDPGRAFSNITAQLCCELRVHPDFPDRDHRTSEHSRHVPSEKPYPSNFTCHHMILRLAG